MEFQIEETCPHCKAELVVVANDEPAGHREYEQFACPSCGKTAGSIRSCAIPRAYLRFPRPAAEYQGQQPQSVDTILH